MLLGFLGFANVYAMRVNLSVTIVAMVNHTAIPHANETSVDICPVSPDHNPTNVVKVYIGSIKLFFFLLFLRTLISFRMVNLPGTSIVKESFWDRFSGATSSPRCPAADLPSCLVLESYSATESSARPSSPCLHLWPPEPVTRC